jgi:lysophospholipase L1-like esterase
MWFRRLPLLLAGALLAVTVAAVRAGASEAALPRTEARLAAGLPLRILAFGSSSTEGVGASSKAATYPSRLEAELARLLPQARILVLNRGVGGEDADAMLRRLPAILAERPDVVIWQTGSNDPLHDVPLDRFEAETRTGIAAIRAAGADVMLMEPQLCRALDGKPAALAYRDALRAIGAELGVPVIRRYDLMRAWLDRGLVTRAELMSTDGLHMADAGYALLGAEVAREIVALVHAPARIGSASGADLPLPVQPSSLPLHPSEGKRS